MNSYEMMTAYKLMYDYTVLMDAVGRDEHGNYPVPYALVLTRPIDEGKVYAELHVGFEGFGDMYAQFGIEVAPEEVVKMIDANVMSGNICWEECIDAWNNEYEPSQADLDEFGWC